MYYLKTLEFAVILSIIECSVCNCSAVRQTSVGSDVCMRFSWFGSVVIVFIFMDKWAIAGSLMQGHLLCYGYVCVCVYLCVFVFLVCNTSC